MELPTPTTAKQLRGIIEHLDFISTDTTASRAQLESAVLMIDTAERLLTALRTEVEAKRDATRHREHDCPDCTQTGCPDCY